MSISYTKAQGRIPVAVVGVPESLDASNYEALIETAKEIQRSGVQRVLLDLGGTRFVSSAGLVALHSVVLLLRGDAPPDPQEGWAALHAVSQGLGEGAQPYVKLLNPGPKVLRTLDVAGLKEYFEVHTDRAAAIASF